MELHVFPHPDPPSHLPLYQICILLKTMFITLLMALNTKTNCLEARQVLDSSAPDCSLNVLLTVVRKEQITLTVVVSSSRSSPSSNWRSARVES